MVVISSGTVMILRDVDVIWQCVFFIVMWQILIVHPWYNLYLSVLHRHFSTPFLITPHLKHSHKYTRANHFRYPQKKSTNVYIYGVFVSNFPCFVVYWFGGVFETFYWLAGNEVFLCGIIWWMMREMFDSYFFVPFLWALWCFCFNFTQYYLDSLCLFFLLLF